MKSRITIELDFDAGNKPVIQIVSQSSDDVRDRLLRHFLENLGRISRWCRIIYKGGGGNEPHRWNIEAVLPEEIPSEINLMASYQEYHRDVVPKEVNTIPRRNIIDQMFPAEKALYLAMVEVEKLPASKSLATVVQLLQTSKNMVSDIIEYHPQEPVGMG